MGDVGTVCRQSREAGSTCQHEQCHGQHNVCETFDSDKLVWFIDDIIRLRLTLFIIPDTVDK